MNSVNFPKIFHGNSTVINTAEDPNRSVLEWLHLLLASEQGTLFGDPGFGLRLRRYFFEQNNYVLRDILIDEIYTAICSFCPAVFLERKNIKITHDHTTLYARISCKNKQTLGTNTYDLVLFRNEDDV